MGVLIIILLIRTKLEGLKWEKPLHQDYQMKWLRKSK